MALPGAKSRLRVMLVSRLITRTSGAASSSTRRAGPGIPQPLRRIRIARAVGSAAHGATRTPAAGLARRVIEELDAIDLSRLRQCQRKECDLLFLDMTRSRSQRWHAENPCGWLERQHRRRAT